MQLKQILHSLSQELPQLIQMIVLIEWKVFSSSSIPHHTLIGVSLYIYVSSDSLLSELVLPQVISLKDILICRYVRIPLLFLNTLKVGCRYTTIMCSGQSSCLTNFPTCFLPYFHFLNVPALSGHESSKFKDFCACMVALAAASVGL